MAQYDVNKAVFTGEHLRDNLCECVTARCAREIAYIIHSNLECSPAIVVLLLWRIPAHADGSSGGEVFTTVCLCVCLTVFLYDISTTDSARITKHNTEMFHDESWKIVYFEIKGSKVKVTSRKNIAGVGLCTPVSTGCF